MEHYVVKIKDSKFLNLLFFVTPKGTIIYSMYNILHQNAYVIIP